MKCSFLIDFFSIIFLVLKKFGIFNMDYIFLNVLNIFLSFLNDLQIVEKFYFIYDREQIFIDESDSDENESLNLEEEFDNSIESLGFEIEWIECDVNDR